LFRGFGESPNLAPESVRWIPVQQPPQKVGRLLSALRFRVWSLGFRVWGYGLGFRIQGFGFRVSGFGFRV